jgi:spore coat polysaccharide biosynthesis protein SpsF
MAVIIVQARMGSSRLPGKVLKPIAGRPMLSYQIERLRRARRPTQIVIATTTVSADDAIAEFCRAEGVFCTRGSQDDVLSRYAEAARVVAAKNVVRVTSDCPLLDPALLDEAIDTFLSVPGGCDYLSNMLEPSWPYGMAVEVFSAKALEEAYAEARDPAEREHVTPFFYWHPQRYRIRSLTHTPNLSRHRWTVDTPEDFEFVSRVLEAIHPVQPEFDMSDVLALLEVHPDWTRINAHVPQKVVTKMNEET